MVFFVVALRRTHQTALIREVGIVYGDVRVFVCVPVCLSAQKVKNSVTLV